MFGLGTLELLLILAVILLLFGASRIPRLARSLGEGLRAFRSSAAPERELPRGDRTGRARP
jgi:sec-independent protein translocase protein TatA